MDNQGYLLKYGDCILLTTKLGFVQTAGFITKPNCYIQVNFKESQIYQRNISDFVFQLMPKMSYDAYKEYSNFKAYYDRAVAQAKPGKDGQSVSQQDRLRMVQLQKKLAEELETNKKIFERRKGEVVQYGNEVQLLHYDSQSFLEGTKNCADQDKSCNMIKLNPQGSKFVCFIVEPRYKYRNVGQNVNYCDVVIFRNMKTGQYLHVTEREVKEPNPLSKEQLKVLSKDYKSVVSEKNDRRMLPDEFAVFCEVNLSTSRNKFTIRLFRSWQDEENKSIITGSQIVRLQHSESGGFLCSDDSDFTGDQQAEVFLWNYKGKSTDIEAVSTNCYFILEIVGDVFDANGQNTTYSGNIGNLNASEDGMIFRLRHLNSGRLVVLQDLNLGKTVLNSVGLADHLKMDIKVTEGRNNRKNINIKVSDKNQQQMLEEQSKFRLVSTNVDVDNRIRSGTSVQIQHLASQKYLIHNTRLKFKSGQNSASTEYLQDKEDIQMAITHKIEDLDFENYQRMDDGQLNQGAKEFLVLQKEPSYENAFFIVPEPIQNIKDTLFVHTSVNTINGNLNEVCQKEYGHSRERQRKIEGVIKDLINFLEDKEIIVDEEAQGGKLDKAFSNQGDDQHDHDIRVRNQKQKIMRELRVIEACVDILHAPFKCGSFNYKDLVQEDAILSLCKLSYTLLSKIVENYELNELYASQWMKLYLNHVLLTTPNNQIGADQFVTQLVNSNKKILDEQISPELIEDFIMKSERSSETSRLLRLLTALCSCQGEALKGNQDQIIQKLTEGGEDREKPPPIRPKAKTMFLMYLNKQKRCNLEVALDLRKNEWMVISQASKKYTILMKQLSENHDEEAEIKFRLKPQDEEFLHNYQAFHQLLELFAKCCLGRNAESQSALTPFYRNIYLINIYQDKDFNFDTRSRCLKLFLNLYLDRDPFQPLVLPSETIIWNDITKPKYKTSQEVQQAITVDFDIKKSKVKIPTMLRQQKEFLREYLKKQKGVIKLSEPSINEMNMEVLRTVLYMINHGFYDNMEELKQITGPIIMLLNGTTDDYNLINFAPSVNGKQETAPSVQRYFPNKQSQIIIQQKCLACDILLRIQALETDSKAVMFIQKLKSDIDHPQSRTNTVDHGRKGGKKVVPEIFQDDTVPEQEDIELLEAISMTKGFESVNESEYVCILFDLMLYRSAELQKRVFTLLLSYFLRKRTLIEAMQSMKILETTKSIQVMEQIKELNKRLKVLQKEMLFWITKNSGDGTTQKQICHNIYQQFEKFCILNKSQEVEEYEEQEGTQVDILRAKTRFASKNNLAEIPEFVGLQSPAYIIFDDELVRTKPNIENQRLLQSFDAVPVALQIIKLKVDRQTNSNELYKALITQCYKFLVSFVRNNTENQSKVYDDLDVFMRDIDKYPIASVLVREIFKNNKKFLTLNVTKWIRQIVNTSEEAALASSKKAMYLKLLEVYCRYEDMLITQNQTEIIIQMTQDTTRSNVLYLFQAEGAKELSVHIENCLQIVQDLLQFEPETPVAFGESFKPKQTSSHDNSQLLSPKPNSFMDNSQILEKQKVQKKNKVIKGTQTMNIPVFNLIQLLRLVTLCCEGRTEVSEKRAKESILSFKVSEKILEMAQDFWPLKTAIFDYLTHCYMESADPNFMAQPGTDQKDESDAEEDNQDGQQAQESDVSVLLKLVENINHDLESYINGIKKQTKLEMPNGDVLEMRQLCEDYIFHSCLRFIKSTLKRKKYDVGSLELKFYVLVKNIAQLFYVAEDRKNKLAVYDLLHYINSSDHQKYLDNVKHPAKKTKNSREIAQLMEEDAENSIQGVDGENLIIDPKSKSSLLQNRINLIIRHENTNIMIQQEFEILVEWLVDIDIKIVDSIKKGKKGKGDINVYSSVKYESIILALLELLDYKNLSKNHQIAGLILLRKIIEVECKEQYAPSADWDSSDWSQFKRIIKIKQDSQNDRGVIQFLCGQIQSQEDPDIQEECMLVCISMIMGGNYITQTTFLQSVTQDEAENKLMLTLKKLLQKNFELTKKYLNEKNAKIEMVYKVKKANEEKRLKEQKLHEDIAAGIIKVEDHNADQEPGQEEEKNLDITLSDQEDEENPVEVKKPKEQSQQDQKEKTLLSTIRILKFIQLLCEGHYLKSQDFLREQYMQSGIKSPRSFDFVAYISNMFSIYVKSYVNCYSTVLGNQIIECLIELIQGPCRLNQRTLVDTKAIDCCRDLLSQGMENQQELELQGFVGKRISLLDQLKMSSVKMLLSILEGPVDEDISERVSSSLGDFEIVAKRMESVYESFVLNELGLPQSAIQDADKVSNALKKNKESFDSCIQEGFDIYSLLNQLAEVLPSDREKIDKFRSQPFYKFYEKNNGVIEVMTEFDILRIFFPLQPICTFLTQNSKNKFLENVERESNQHKLLGLCSEVPSFIEEMEHLEVMSHMTIQITPDRLNSLRDQSLLIAVMISGVQLTQYKYQAIIQEDGSYNYQAHIEFIPDYIIFGLGCCQLITALLILIGFCVNNINLIVKAGWRQRVDKNQASMTLEKKQIEERRSRTFKELKSHDLDITTNRNVLQIEGPYSAVFWDENEKKREFGSIALAFEYYWISLTFLLNNGEFIFFVIYYVFSVQGLIQAPVFYSFHLLDVINRFTALQNVILSVTTNLSQLVMTAMLGVILIYNFACIGFLFISDNFFDDTINQGLLNKQGDSVCKSLMHCFLSTINYGLRAGGGYGDWAQTVTVQEWNWQARWIRFFYDISFNLIVSTICLNVIFGIIIDTFAQLREASSERENDSKNICFICGLSRQILDRDTDEGFDAHTEYDHYVWNYLYFIIHLSIKDKTELNGAESYISRCIEREDMVWFPQHKSIRLMQVMKKREQADMKMLMGDDVQEDQLDKKIEKCQEILSQLESQLN